MKTALIATVLFLFSMTSLAQFSGGSGGAGESNILGPVDALEGMGTHTGVFDGRWVEYQVSPEKGFQILKDIQIDWSQVDGTLQQYDPYLGQTHFTVLENGHISDQVVIPGKRLDVVVPQVHGTSEVLAIELYENNVWTLSPAPGAPLLP